MKPGIRIKILILLSIFLSGIGLCYSQNYSTVGEIWDFDIGDVLHFSEWGSSGSSGMYSIENIEILDKTYSQDSSSVVYYQFVKKETEMSYDPYYIFEEYYEYLTKEYLDSIFYADSVYTNANYNYRKQSYYNNSQLPYLTQYGHYVDGCGLAYQYWYQVDPPYMSTYEKELIYYKKGDEEWGTPHILINIEEKEFEASMVTYPNPFTTSTTLEYELYTISNIQYTI